MADVDGDSKVQGCWQRWQCRGTSGARRARPLAAPFVHGLLLLWQGVHALSNRKLSLSSLLYAMPIWASVAARRDEPTAPVPAPTSQRLVNALRQHVH